jgi:translation initiation factor IF-1
MPDATIHAAGPILEQLGEVLYRAELPNGKRILAHLSKALAVAGARFEADQRVVMELTPYDFDQARILRPADGNDG